MESVIQTRLAIFHQQTIPVLDWWRQRCDAQGRASGEEQQQHRRGGKRLQLWDVQGEQSIEAVYDDVRRVFGEFIAHCFDDMTPG